MTLSETAKKYKMPLYALQAMKTKGLICEPVEGRDLTYIADIATIWNDDEWIKMILRGKKPQKRFMLCRESGFLVSGKTPDKLDSYIYNRYMNLKDKERLPTKRLIGELMSNYSLPDRITMRNKLLGKIKKIRQRVYDVKLYYRKKGIPLSMKKNLGIG